MKPWSFVNLCTDAISTLSQYNPIQTETAYQLLAEAYHGLAGITPENETSELLYAHCMYHFAIEERYWIYYDFEALSLAILNIMLICEHAYKRYPEPKDAPMEIWLMRNKHAIIGPRVSKIIERIGTKPKACTCALCKSHVADKSNSHMAPQFLIKELVNIKPNKNRDYECIVEINDAKAEFRLYFGQAVNEDEVNVRIVTQRTPEETKMAEYVPNPVTRNNLLCVDCEDRFCSVENAYKRIQIRLQNEWNNYQRSPKRKPFKPSKYDVNIPYLFWLSVVWRMSVGGLGIKLPEEHEERIRAILNKCLISKDVVDTSRLEDADHCYYYTHEECHDMRDEPIAITGSRNPRDPYVVVMGNHVLCFFTDQKVAEDMRSRDLVPPLLNGTSMELVNNQQTFTNYWERMLWLKTENAIYNQTHLGQCDIKEVYRYSGLLHPVAFTHAPYTSGDFVMHSGKYPITIPWSFIPFIKKMIPNPDITSEELAKGTIFSADEITFMRTACAGRLKRLQDELAAYYKKNPEQTSGQLVLPEAEYDRDKFDFYAHWPVEIQGKPEQSR